MEHLFEFIFELLFGFAKGTPDVMPNLEYKDNFTVKYSTKRMALRICATMLIMTTFTVLSIFIKHETRILYAIFAVLGAILFTLAIIDSSFSCSVSEEAMISSRFHITKRRITWDSISCIRVVEATYEKTVIIALYDLNGKCCIDLNTDMENAWYIVKMAKDKTIEIREEKNLTMKQLKQL